MRKRTALVGGVVAFVAIAAAFFLLRPEGPAFSNVGDLVSALRSEGIECDALNVSAPDPTPEIVDFGSCQIDGKTVNLHVYKNEDRVAEHVEGNVSARELNNPNYFTSLVAGSNWVVDTYSEETAKEIQEAIGGEIH